MRFVRGFLLFLAVFVCVSVVSLPASAADAAAERVRTRADFSGGDWALASLSGLGTGIVGGAVGGLAGAAIMATIWNAGNREGDVGFAGLGMVLIGAGGGSIVAGTFSGPLGTWGYGNMAGFRGSYWAAVGGWASGLAVTALFSVLANTTGIGQFNLAAVISLVALPPVGATAGYVLSLDEAPAPAPPALGLLHYDGESFGLGVPDLTVSIGEDGAFNAATVMLVGGRF